jgi:hypothetical protein
MKLETRDQSYAQLFRAIGISTMFAGLLLCAVGASGWYTIVTIVLGSLMIIGGLVLLRSIYKTQPWKNYFKSDLFFSFSFTVMGFLFAVLFMELTGVWYILGIWLVSVWGIHLVFALICGLSSRLGDKIEYMLFRG